ncbi:DNA-binding MarR family transcriptional regulator [Rhodococcus sp. OK302]|nr:DNA-binding MarR family transcriptional regulator [Rhodococcus sp. OK302]
MTDKKKAPSAGGHEMVHQLRALVVQLDLFGAEFATQHRLHATDVRALICLLDAERSGRHATPGWLGQQLGLNSASVTALIDRMNKNGLVERERDDNDRRRVLLGVTDRAKDLGLSFFGPLIGHAIDVLETFTPQQLETIGEFLTKMSTAVETTRADQAGAHEPSGE